jgi:hypothetical protein
VKKNPPPGWQPGVLLVSHLSLPAPHPPPPPPRTTQGWSTSGAPRRAVDSVATPSTDAGIVGARVEHQHVLSMPWQHCCRLRVLPEHPWIGLALYHAGTERAVPWVVPWVVPGGSGGLFRGGFRVVPGSTKIAKTAHFHCPLARPTTPFFLCPWHGIRHSGFRQRRGFSSLLELPPDAIICFGCGPQHEVLATCHLHFFSPWRWRFDSS